MAIEFHTTLTLADIVLQVIVTLPAILAGVAAIVRELRRNQLDLVSEAARHETIQFSVAKRLGIDEAALKAEADAAATAARNGATPP